jgi:hypothetical protein
MFHLLAIQKKWMAQPLSGLGFTLAEEEHEQKYQLLVVQLQFDCQLEHGNSLVCAGRPANLFKGWLWRLRRACRPCGWGGFLAA